MTPTEHNTAQQPRLKAFLDRELSAWRRLAVRLHLTRCAACREEMQAMQQIGEELRAQTVDPLDTNLRSRILATVRDMTPLAAPPVQARRPALVWGGAVAALLLAAVFAPRFRSNYSLVASRDSSATQEQAASAPAAANKSALESKTAVAAPQTQSPADVRGSVKPPSSLAPMPQKETAKRASAHIATAVVTPPTGLSYGGSARPKERAGGGSVLGQSMSVQQPVALERAGFDLNGYRFVARDGRRIDVPFKKNLEAVRFARSADGKMALDEAPSPPILYLSAADRLHNDAVPDSLWQPLPPGITSTQPRYVRPTLDWQQFLTMRWYPNMTVVGGLTYTASGHLAFVWLPGSHVEIGGVLYPDYAAYRAYADAHPDALRLHAVYDSAHTAARSLPTSPPRNPNNPASDKRRP